jgi:hypothetical protein
LGAAPLTTAPVVTVVLVSAGPAAVKGPHEGVPLPDGDAGSAAGGDGAPAAPVAAAPAAGGLVEPLVHGWVTGGAAGAGAAGAGVGSGLGVGVVVPAAGGALAAGWLVLVGVVAGSLGDGVVAGGRAGAGAVVGGTGAGAADVVTEPFDVCPVLVAAAAGTVAAPDAAVVVVVSPAPTPAEAEATTQRHASITETELTATANRRAPNPATVSAVLECTRSRLIRYPTRRVRVTVCRCPAPSSAANLRTRVPTLMPASARAGRWSLITLCG